MSPAQGEPADLGVAPAPLRPTDSWRDAARAAMWPQVERVLLLEPALRDPGATDELKRYRVATRRLRAALRFFDGALPEKAARDVRPELAELARAVGRVRDLDVRIAGLPDDEALRPLRDAWAAERAQSAAEVQRRLGAKRHERLVASLVRLVREDRGSHGDGRDRPAVRDRAGSAVWSGFERLRAAATALDGADVEALHDLRILAKRFRYGLEFLAPVLGEDREWLVARLVAIQDHLGALNDADVAAAATRVVLGDAGIPLRDEQRTAIEAYEMVQRAIVERHRDAAPAVMAPVLAPTFARRLSRSILGPLERRASRA